MIEGTAKVSTETTNDVTPSAVTPCIRQLPTSSSETYASAATAATLEGASFAMLRRSTNGNVRTITTAEMKIVFRKKMSSFMLKTAVAMSCENARG